MEEFDKIRLTSMGYAVDDGRILTYRPVWEDGHPVGATIVGIPQQSINVMAFMSHGQTIAEPSLGMVVEAMFLMHQGQRHLTMPFASPYIDKPIKTFFAKGWVPSMELDQRSLMSDAAMLNYAMGLSRGDTMGLIERTYREVRNLVANFAMMAARASERTGAEDDEILSDDERPVLAGLLSDADANIPWVVGTGWLCCWHDHMATKKDFSSSILKSWFSQVESPLKVTSLMSWDEFILPSTIEEIRRIGMQCLQMCWVIPDDGGDVVDVLASEEAWDEMFAREEVPASKESTLSIMTDEIRQEMRENPDEDEPDDIIPESMMSLKRDIDSMTPPDIDLDDE